MVLAALDGSAWLIAVFVIASNFHTLASQFVRAKGDMTLFAVQGLLNTALVIWLNSLFLAVVGTLITLLISAMCGYALAIYRFEIKYVNLVFGVFLLGTLIPGETLTVPQFSVISAMGLYNNIWGVILPVVTTTTGIFMYRQHYMSLPLSLVEAARIDGASEWKIFSNIMLPLGSNVTITLTIFSFMWRWNDYILPLLVLSDQKKYTIQIAIKNFIGNTGVDWSSILAASVLSILPIVILFVILQKYIVGGVSAGGVKG